MLYLARPICPIAIAMTFSLGGAAAQVADVFTGTATSAQQIIRSQKNFRYDTYFGPTGQIPNSGGLPAGPSTGGVYFGGGRPWADPRYFGAKGDGIADDTVAINAAINAALGGVAGSTDNAMRAGVVYLPKGFYNVSETIEIRKAGLTIYGAGGWTGSGTSAGWLARGGTVIRWTGTNPNAPIFRINESEGVKIKDLRMVNASDTQCFAAIQFSTRTDGHAVVKNSVDDVWIGDMPGMDMAPSPLERPFKYGILIQNIDPILTGTYSGTSPVYRESQSLSGDSNRFAMIAIRKADIGVQVQNTQALNCSWDHLYVSDCRIGVSLNASTVGRNWGLYLNGTDLAVKDLARVTIEGLYSERSEILLRQTNGAYVSIKNGYFLWGAVSNGKPFVDVSDREGTSEGGTAFAPNSRIPATVTVLEDFLLTASASGGADLADPPYILLAAGPNNQNRVRRDLELNNVEGFTEINLRNEWGSVIPPDTFEDQRRIRGRMRTRGNVNKFAASEFSNILINSGSLRPSQTDPTQPDIDFSRYDRLVSKERTIVLPVISGTVSGDQAPIGVYETHSGTGAAIGAVGPAAPNGSFHLRIGPGVNPALSVKEGGIWQVK